MKTAIFRSYKNGYYTFTFENGNDMVFEEIRPKALFFYDLKNDNSFIDQTFELNFSEHFENKDENFVFYIIESLKLIKLK